MTGERRPALDGGVDVDVVGWLDGFAACVRSRDLDGGRAYFDPTCTSFGTRADRVEGLDDLVEHQWRPIWDSTEDFRFTPGSVRSFASDDASLRVAVTTWTSLGVQADGTTFERAGRASIVLRRAPNAPHGLLAEHSHFSVLPTSMR